MKHRFFVDYTEFESNDIVLTGENAAHAAVLRLAIGEEIVIYDNNGMDYHCIVTSTGKSETRAKFLHKSVNMAEPQIAITLFQALPKTGKMEEIVDKCTQLGIMRIVPVVTARCVSKISDKDAKKVDRWQKIAQSAASQSGRARIPKVNSVMTFDAALENTKCYGTAFVCYENEESLSLKVFLSSMIQKPLSISYFIGSEGGFTDEEITKFNKINIPTVSLGPRILRTELAGAAVLTNILYELDS